MLKPAEKELQSLEHCIVMAARYANDNHVFNTLEDVVALVCDRPFNDVTAAEILEAARYLQAAIAGGL